MDELKEEMKKMDIDVKSDIQIIRSLWDKYNMPGASEEERIHILGELEYYLHQVSYPLNYLDYVAITAKLL